jgi:hypothetical protein
MKTSLAMRLVIVGLLTSFGCALLLAGHYPSISLAGAAIILMPLSEQTKAFSRHELWLIFGGLLALAAATFAASDLLAASAADVVHRVACHPGFVIPFWMLVLYGACSASGRGRKEKPMLNHPASGNGAIASLFHFAGLGRAVPEPVRWAA